MTSESPEASDDIERIGSLLRWEMVASDEFGEESWAELPLAAELLPMGGGGLGMEASSCTQKEPTLRLASESLPSLSTG